MSAISLTDTPVVAAQAEGEGAAAGARNIAARRADAEPVRPAPAAAAAGAGFGARTLAMLAGVGKALIAPLAGLVLLVGVWHLATLNGGN